MNEKHFCIAAVKTDSGWKRLKIENDCKRDLCAEIIKEAAKLLESDPAAIRLHWGAVLEDNKRVGSYFIGRSGK